MNRSPGFPSRRQALAGIASTALCYQAIGQLSSVVHAAPSGRRTRMGLVAYSVGIRRGILQQESKAGDLFEPMQLLQHAHRVGLGGVQCALGNLSSENQRALRSYAEENDLYIESILSLPTDRNQLDRAQAELQSAASVGARCARTTIIPGRRYEYFDDLKTYREFADRGRRMLERCIPIAEKAKVAIAIENHKDQRNEERIDLLRTISSEYVGACVDTGNSIALLEDPIETIEAFAPWALSVHLKDQSLYPYDEGFLLGDVPLGEGSLDIPRMVDILRRAKPDVRFSLELITRDPLKVPCLTNKYWATFPDLPGKHLASTLSYVREHQTTSGQTISTLAPASQLATEDENIARSLKYAQETLEL